MPAALLSPLGFAILLTLLLALAWRRLPRALCWIAVLVEIVLIVAMTPAAANALVWKIESRVPESSACTAPAPTTIVVLSGGVRRAPENAHDVAALEGDTLRRVLAGVALWRDTPDATLVFAGGGPFAVSESSVLQDFAERLGVPPISIRRENQSQTTWENAAQLRTLLPALSQRIWLVSSALHLPRAALAFRAHGFEPCLYASDRRYLPPGGVGYYLPQSSALIKTELALHELVGEQVYRWRSPAP